MSGEIYVRDSPRALVEGGALAYTYDWEDTVTASSSVITVYLKSTGADITTTVTSGSSSESGTVSTYKTVTAQTGHGGDKYICTLAATVGGVASVRKLIINIDEKDEE